MGSLFERTLEKYDYTLPPALIAQQPARPRDSARLLIYSRQEKKIQTSTFAQLGAHLPKRSVLVFNETRVLPARIPAYKETGGRVYLMYTGLKGNLLECMADRKLDLGSRVYITKKLFFAVKGQNGKYFYLMPSFSITKLSEILKKYGIIPLPPYIQNSPLNEQQRKTNYQTVFAKHDGSLAAPTASLHFTNRLIAKLKQQGVRIEYLTLHVGLGTFAPLTPENLETKRLHEEYYTVDASVIRRITMLKKKGYTIIPVGTTCARALETIFKNYRSTNKKKIEGYTDLFIDESYSLKCIEGIITNFHVPKSSLLMLVAALIGRKKLLELYQYAIAQKFRFFSFGDGMLIL